MHGAHMWLRCFEQNVLCLCLAQPVQANGMLAAIIMGTDSACMRVHSAYIVHVHGTTLNLRTPWLTNVPTVPIGQTQKSKERLQYYSTC